MDCSEFSIPCSCKKKSAKKEITKKLKVSQFIEYLVLKTRNVKARRSRFFKVPSSWRSNGKFNILLGFFQILCFHLSGIRFDGISAEIIGRLYCKIPERHNFMNIIHNSQVANWTRLNGRSCHDPLSGFVCRGGAALRFGLLRVSPRPAFVICFPSLQPLAIGRVPLMFPPQPLQLAPVRVNEIQFHLKFVWCHRNGILSADSLCGFSQPPAPVRNAECYFWISDEDITMKRTETWSDVDRNRTKCLAPARHT